MATKANLLSAINGFITAVVNITTHRQSMSALVEEVYPTKVDDSNTDETYTTKNADFSYNISIVKQGRSVRINGSYTNLRAYALASGTKVFELKDNQYKGDTSQYLGIGANHVPASQINTISAIGIGVSTQFSVTYNANI